MLEPHSYDVAFLSCHSLLAPETATAIWHRFTHVLGSPDACRAQVLASARTLGRTRMGAYTNLVVGLHRLADEILSR
ncbi:hypothetical protein NBCG_03154 [Nocardioidaceae bacterium Broad-1]|nr:hypothetical protein NBCG_03154 [Nocardioidaceae bacterium Broad-1]